MTAARTSQVIAGRGLHCGAPATVRFVESPGPVRVRAGDVTARLDELLVTSTRRSTDVATADGRLRVATVEHLLAALGAASVREGLVVELAGPEIPLADGGAEAFSAALAALDLPPSPPALVVERRGVVLEGGARYEFRPACGVEIEVEVDFDDPRIARHAAWTGDVADFRSRIAPARTFGFAHEIEALLAAGLASHVTPESVVVVSAQAVHACGAPFAPDEPARHKLLDLIGDLTLHGGPPRGALRAVRPGHGATHAAVRRALAEGILAPFSPVTGV